jgi:hypothetical protein
MTRDLLSQFERVVPDSHGHGNLIAQPEPANVNELFKRCRQSWWFENPIWVLSDKSLG